MEKQENKNQINEALALAQAEIKSAKFNRKNPHYGNPYADITALRDAYQEPFAKNGLSLVQIVEDKPDGTMVLVTKILHKSGEFIESRFPIRVEPNATMQAIGSKLTYARRYSLAAIIAVGAEEDDDGERDKEEAEKRQEDSETISAYQAKELESLIGEDIELKNNLLSAYRQKYINKRPIDTIKDLPSKSYDWIVQSIEQKNNDKRAK